jgi:hypothetical protein
MKLTCMQCGGRWGACPCVTGEGPTMTLAADAAIVADFDSNEYQVWLMCEGEAADMDPREAANSICIGAFRTRQEARAALLQVRGIKLVVVEEREE